MAIRHDDHPTERVERVERIEHMHDRPAVMSTPGSSNVNVGGTPARVGFSNGVNAAFELPGSGLAGAFLDSNPVSGLIRNSRSSLQLGRYNFEVRNGIAPTGGAISGRPF